jgi:quinol monooxygenase YgiN
MAKHFAYGSWQVAPGNGEAFMKAWTRFLTWTQESQSGFGFARLLGDEENPGHFVSISEWNDGAARLAWQNDEKFTEMFSACRELCDDFQQGAFEASVSIGP